MNRILLGTLIALLVFFVTPTPVTSHAQGCTTLKSGALLYRTPHKLAGTPITTGVNPYGYNYQAHSFNGSYFNSYAGSAGFDPYDGDDAEYLVDNAGAEDHWAWPYRHDELAMKWNDTWLSNQDCDGDGLLDRHFGYASYAGSGAWETNHQKGVTADVDGKENVWTYFVKIVAPADATLSSGVWVTNPGGSEIGPVIWNDFAIIQEVYNDPANGVHGIWYLSPTAAGFGRFGPQ